MMLHWKGVSCSSVEPEDAGEFGESKLKFFLLFLFLYFLKYYSFYYNLLLIQFIFYILFFICFKFNFKIQFCFFFQSDFRYFFFKVKNVAIMSNKQGFK